MSNNLSLMRHQLAEEIQQLIKAKDMAQNIDEYTVLGDLVDAKKQQLDHLLEKEFDNNRSEYQAALYDVKKSVNDVKEALKGLKSLASAIENSTRAIKSVEAILKLIA